MSTTGAVTLPLPKASELPPAILSRRNFAAWKWIPRDGGRAKFPVDIRNGRGAKANDPTTWATFEEVYRYAERHGYGLWYFLAEGEVGIDLDNSYDPVTDEPTPLAASILGEIHTYAERSISGNVKAIAYGTKPGPRCRRKGLSLEVYEGGIATGRGFALTGQRLPGAPLAINECQDAIDHIYRTAFPEQAPRAVPSGPPPVLEDDDRAVLDWLHECRPGFTALWNGPHGEDPSADDLALCNHLAYRGTEPMRVDRLFRQSGLMRPKWDERRGVQTYGERTVAKAFDGRTGFYEARPQRQVALTPPVPPVEENRFSSDPVADPALAEYLAMPHEELARRAYRAERFNRGYLRFNKNKGVKTQKPTIRAVLLEYENKARAGLYRLLPVSSAYRVVLATVMRRAGSRDAARRAPGWRPLCRRSRRVVAETVAAARVAPSPGVAEHD